MKLNELIKKCEEELKNCIEQEEVWKKVIRNRIKTINELEKELHKEKIKLQRLEDQKSVLYLKYFSVTSSYQDIPSHSNERKEPYIDYIAELEEINDKTGKSLNQELEEQRNKVRTLEYYIKRKKFDESVDNV
jgi:L-lysine 2,3-aminomutase